MSVFQSDCLPLYPHFQEYNCFGARYLNINISLTCLSFLLVPLSNIVDASDHSQKKVQHFSSSILRFLSFTNATVLTAEVPDLCQPKRTGNWFVFCEDEHLFRIQEVIWPSRSSEDAYDHP